MTSNSFNFFKGIMTGALGALVMGVVLIYILNMTGYAVIQFPADSGINAAINFAYENLKLSIIPFIGIFVSYVYLLKKLDNQLSDPHTTIDLIAQTDHIIETSISLFFGIGVIWTAIGMRSALMFALGDPESAAADGAFAILQRMVDGGILLALSTTIFGGVGGYLMRVFKMLYLGQRLQSYYSAQMQEQSDSAYAILQRIEQHLERITSPATNKDSE